MTTSDRRWTPADRELIVRAWYGDPHAKPWRWEPASADRVLDALAAAGWEPRCDCDGVAHDLPILRSHVRGEPGCTAHAYRGGTDG